MAHDAPRVSSSELLAPVALAEQLEELLQKLADGLREVTDPGVRRGLESSPEAMERVCDSLRSIEGLLHVSGSETLARRERNLSHIAVRFGEGIRDLGEANGRVAAGVHAQIRELDAVAQMPPGPECIARLRAIATDMQQSATQMAASLEAMAVHVESTTERLAALETSTTQSAEPDLYDEATGLYNRTALDQRLDEAVRRGGTWCFLQVDMDGLAQVNQRFGRVVGDALLYKIARIVERHFHEKVPESLVARYDGSFGVYLPASLGWAADIAEHVRRGVASSRWQYRGQPQEAVLETTVSIGLTPYCRGDTLSSLLLRADQALRRAKEQGRNCVVRLEP